MADERWVSKWKRGDSLRLVSLRRLVSSLRLIFFVEWAVRDVVGLQLAAILGTAATDGTKEALGRNY